MLVVPRFINENPNAFRYHACRHKNQGTHDLLMCLDYGGIVLLMTSASIPLIRFGFYCVLHIQRIYYLILAGLALIVGILTTQIKWSSRQPTLAIRLGGFSSIALLDIVISLHSLELNQWHLGSWTVSSKAVLMTLLLNILGVIAYCSQLPERISRRFDIYGASHQIFHALVVGAALAYFLGLIASLRDLSEHKC